MLFGMVELVVLGVVNDVVMLCLFGGQVVVVIIIQESMCVLQLVLGVQVVVFIKVFVVMLMCGVGEWCVFVEN